MSEETTTTANAGDSTEQQPTTTGPTFSQEDVDRIVNDRLARERKKYEGFDDLKSKADQFDSVTAERDDLAAKVQKFEGEKQRAALVAEIAKAAGVPANALRGETREELEAHAEDLKSFIPSAPVIPGQEKSPSHVGDDPMREFARSLFDQAKNQ